MKRHATRAFAFLLVPTAAAIATNLLPLPFAPDQLSALLVALMLDTVALATLALLHVTRGY